MVAAGELYEFSGVYRHFILNKCSVVRDRINARYTEPYYLCAIVLFDVSKDSDIFHSHELLVMDVID